MERYPAIADEQDGVFTAAQATAAGWTAWAVRRHRRDGDWLPVVGKGLISRGRLDPRSNGVPPRVLARAAQLTWPDAVACRRTAAGLHGFPVTSGREADVFTRAGRRRGSGLHPHVRPPGLRIVELTGGLRTTDRRETALHCLANLPFEEALDLFAWLSTRDVVTREQLEGEAIGRRGRRGAVQLRKVLAVTAAGAVSGAEYRFHRLLQDGGLAGWVAGAQVVGADGAPVRVDVLFRVERLVVEIDGERSHRGRDAFVRDRRRQNALVGAGYTVLRFTWWDLVERPEAVLTEVRRALGGRRG